jgi:hypothetical protein
MELVNWQYSGSDKGIVKGIGVVNAVWQTSKDNYIPVDYRIWNPPDDGKTKNDHFRDMLSCAKNRGLEPEMVVADSWYSSLINLKSVRSHGWDWVMGLKKNRLVHKPHIQLCELEIPDDGLKVHLKGYGWIKVFRFEAKSSSSSLMPPFASVSTPSVASGIWIGSRPASTLRHTWAMPAAKKTSFPTPP